MLRTPVAMLVFNRPEHTARVFEAVRAAKPGRLFVVADGPREGKAGEAELCARTRAVFEKIDWSCEVERMYSEKNLGCRERIGSGISAVFDRVERCIFLEDDCLPEPTFFRFCEEMLERYAADERIVAVSGDGFTSAVGGMRFPHSYYFTRYVHIWGWATWRRAWEIYDGRMRKWPSVRETKWLRELLGSRSDALFWKLWFEMCHDGRLNTWDIPWVFSCWLAGRERGSESLAICPDRNLITNIGFDGTGTHVGKSSPLASLAVRAMSFPLTHPDQVVRDERADAWTGRACFTGGLKQRWKRWKRYAREGIKARA